jgi:hypothetical protein
LQNIDAPFSIQDPLQKNSVDNNAASWNLSRIQLPSGGVIQVNYETDDYAYVQQQTAAQMTELVDASGGSSINLTDGDLKVRFKLEQPIPVSASVDEKKEVAKYLDVQQKQLLFKLKINLRSVGEGFYEYITGYADLDFSKTFGLEKDAAGENYVNGYVYVKAEKGYHPFSLRAWQHLRTDQPDLANSGSRLSQTSSNSERISQMRGLGSVLTQVMQMFQGFNNFCKKKGWGREVVAGKSWVRLSSPDKIKFGGGSRVRQITMSDQWAQNAEGIYGQVYEYTTQENNTTISSGVAAYEPIVGGDENALHYAKKFTQTVPLRSDNNFFFEYPINESCYPGPQVGYGKVTVSSLAAASLAGKQVQNIILPDGKSLFPTGTNTSYGTTGMTMHEFYTAKDFPVITDETDKLNKPFRMNIMIPLLGGITASNLTTSQGYSIIVNDMHGKQKKVSNFRQDRNGIFDPEPISWVKYNYRTETVANRNGKSSLVSNVFKDNNDGTLSVPSAQEVANASVKKYFIGQETEFFTDMRQFEDIAWGGGANVNVDGVFILFGVIPIPSWWPNINKNQQRLRTSVVNKVVFKSGIQESVEAYDAGSLVTTKNIKWDKLTGAPVLTSVTNDFNAPIYSYQIPAYTQYAGMGAAYQNTGARITISNVLKGVGNEYLFTAASQNLLSPGDELLLYPDQNFRNPITKVVFTGSDSKGELTLSSASSLSLKSYYALIVRSGYRNQLSVMAGSMTGLQDPSVPGQKVLYNKAVTVPSR